MHFGSKEYLSRCVDFFIKQAILARNPKELCNYYPINIHVDLTDDCNLSCIHCHDHSVIKNHAYIDWSTFKNAVLQIKEIDAGITFGNKGEPFLHPEASQMIRYAKKEGIFTNIITNATLLGQSTIDNIVESRVERVVFSLDTAVPEVYERSRNGARYKNTFLNVMRLLKKNLENGSPVFINISCVAHKTVFNTLEETKKYFSRFPVDNIFISPLHSQFGLTKIEEETIFIREKKNKEDINNHPICMNGFDRMFIYPDGRVSLCDNEIFGLYTLGNVNLTTLKDMWNNESARIYRRSLIQRNYSLIERNGKLCSICDFKWIKNTDNHPQYVKELLSEEIARNDEFIKDLTKRHSSKKYEAVLEEIKRLEKL